MTKRLNNKGKRNENSNREPRNSTGTGNRQSNHRKRTRQPNVGQSFSNRRPRPKHSNTTRHHGQAKKNATSQIQSIDDQSIPMTPDAIESIVMGIDLFADGDVGEIQKPSKQVPAKSTTENFEQSRKERTGKRKDVILRLRVDYPQTSKEMNPKRSRKTTATDDMTVVEELPCLYGTLGDGKYSIRVMLLNPDGIWSERLKREVARNLRVGSNKANDWIVKVHGYAATEKFWHVKYQIFPLICLTSISVLRTIDSEHMHSSTLGVALFPSAAASNGNRSCIDGVSCKAQAGTIGTFLIDRGPFLTNMELAGCSRMFDPNLGLLKSGNSDVLSPEAESAAFAASNLEIVQECMSRHSAMITLRQPSSSSTSKIVSSTGNESQSSSSGPATDSSNENSSGQSTQHPPGSPSKSKRPAQHAWELYDGALREFKTSQMDRQKASLGTNAGRESAERAALVIQRHNAALELALKEEGHLTVELLTKWHKVLLQGLDPDAGKIRSRKVRCGHTVFCPPERIREELELYCAGLKSLELRLDMASNALHVILFAAVAMFGIIDIHPFLDGNGRLSRIVANYALKKLPFPINLFATPVQRNKYVVALEQTRHVLAANCAFGEVSRDDLVQVVKYAGVFGALVDLLMDRVARAATALGALWEEKSCLAAEAAEAQAARRVRERAAKGTCMICLDEKPNIATLCCGNAIHLNCCAEWLSGNNKCPICRHEMPSISGRVVRAMGDPREEENEANNDMRQEDPSILSREYQNFVDRFWNEIRQNSRGSATRVPPAVFNQILFRGNTLRDRDEHVYVGQYGSDGEFSDDSALDSDMELPPLHELATAGMNVSRESQSNRDSGMNQQEDGGIHDTTTTFEDDINDPRDDDVNDTTTTFEEEEENRTSDVSESMTTTIESTEENTTTTGDFSDTSYYEPEQRVSTICAGAMCRNRPAVDCTNGLCGRCCVLGGFLQCPRHHSNRY